MTLNQLFDSVQYGDEYMKEKALKEEILKCYDNDLDVFYASNRCKQLSGRVVMSEAEELKVNRLISKLTLVEDRLETGKLMSSAYRKIQSSAIMDDCRAIQEEITKTRKVENKKIDIFGKIIGTAKYFVENSLDDEAVLSKSTNPLLNKVISEEKNAIERIL